MNKIPFYFVDVFAESKYAGNQLAVFCQAGSLSDLEMQQIAREVNFSETTFILSDEMQNGGFGVRIFTPGEEVPFAGHPTLGTAAVIRSEILAGKADKVILNLKVGQIPVSFSPDGYSWMRQVQPKFGPKYAIDTFAPLLNLEPADFDERFPIQEVSTGLPFFIVPLKSLDALIAARVHRDRYFDLVSRTEAKGILIFSPETHEHGRDLSVRVFVEYFGVPEDPATGSGNGCLAGYLVAQRYFGKESVDVKVEQGYEIGRPSLLLLKAQEKDGGIFIDVGGKSVPVARGEWGSA
jgi:trans-2,3-dihydro-3-hydroxyanthranilate isomerase